MRSTGAEPLCGLPFYVAAGRQKRWMKTRSFSMYRKKTGVTYRVRVWENYALHMGP